jgi:hypothetical protein
MSEEKTVTLTLDSLTHVQFAALADACVQKYESIVWASVQGLGAERYLNSTHALAIWTSILAKVRRAKDVLELRAALVDLQKTEIAKALESGEYNDLMKTQVIGNIFTAHVVEIRSFLAAARTNKGITSIAVENLANAIESLTVVVQRLWDLAERTGMTQNEVLVSAGVDVERQKMGL